MSISWEELRTQVRRTIVKDIPLDAVEEPNWTDEQMLDACRWVLDSFCSHTAPQRTVEYNNSTIKTLPNTYYNMLTDRKFILPTDVFDDISDTAIVSVVNKSKTSYLDPLRLTTDLHPYSNQQGFWLTNDNELNVRSNLFSSDSSLVVSYYTYYDYPVADSDIVRTPRWSTTAICYAIGAHLMTSRGISSSMINQWKSKSDSGTPEHNAFRVQQKWMFDIYNAELSRHPIQDRRNAFRNNHQ